jgi:hypothetical protein
MNAGLGVLQGLLAVGFLARGTLKLLLPKEKVAAKGAWANDFSAGQVKLIGLAEPSAQSVSSCQGGRASCRCSRRWPPQD